MAFVCCWIIVCKCDEVSVPMIDLMALFAAALRADVCDSIELPKAGVVILGRFFARACAWDMLGKALASALFADSIARLVDSICAFDNSIS